MRFIACVAVDGTNPKVSALWQSCAAPAARARVVVALWRLDDTTSGVAFCGLELAAAPPHDLAFTVAEAVPTAGVESYVRNKVGNIPLQFDAAALPIDIPIPPTKPTGPKVIQAVFDYAAAQERNGTSAKHPTAA
jgi:hypothetical protein